MISLLALMLLSGPAAPTSKETIAAALTLQDLLLKRGEGCQNVGTNPTDRTVGQYLAGWLDQTFVPDQGKNRRQWISTSCRADDQKRAAWQCDLQLYMETVPRSESMIGGWGLRFLMDARKKPLRTWFMCLGSG